MGKAYVCNRYPRLRISQPGQRDIEFQGGLFIAETPEQERTIEASSWWKVYIHPRDLEVPADSQEIAIPIEIAAERPRRGRPRKKVQDASA